MFGKMISTSDDVVLTILRLALGVVFFAHGSQKMLGWFGGAAFAIIVEMIGAVLTIHIHNGFFMNWMGRQKGEGFEYHLIAIALAFLIMVRGAGALSVDYMVSSRDFRRNGERQ